MTRIANATTITTITMMRSAMIRTASATTITTTMMRSVMTRIVSAIIITTIMMRSVMIRIANAITITEITGTITITIITAMMRMRFSPAGAGKPHGNTSLLNWKAS